MRSVLIIASLLSALVLVSPAPAAQTKTAPSAKASVLSPPPSDFLSRLRTKAVTRTVSRCTSHSAPWYCQRYNVRSCWRDIGWNGFCTAWYLVKNVYTGEWRCFDGYVSGVWNGANVDINAVVFNWYRNLAVCSG